MEITAVAFLGGGVCALMGRALIETTISHKGGPTPPPPPPPPPPPKLCNRIKVRILCPKAEWPPPELRDGAPEHIRTLLIETKQHTPTPNAIHVESFTKDPLLTKPRLRHVAPEERPIFPGANEAPICNLLCAGKHKLKKQKDIPL